MLLKRLKQYLLPELRIVVPVRFRETPLWELNRWKGVLVPFLTRVCESLGEEGAFDVVEVYRRGNFPAVKLGPVHWRDEKRLH